MEWQLLMVAVAVSLAAGYVGRASWRTWAGSAAGCGSGCGKCATPSAVVTPESRRRITLPQV